LAEELVNLKSKNQDAFYKTHLRMSTKNYNHRRVSDGPYVITLENLIDRSFPFLLLKHFLTPGKSAGTFSQKRESEMPVTKCFFQIEAGIRRIHILQAGKKLTPNVMEDAERTADG
jgi:hypothetical protein